MTLELIIWKINCKSFEMLLAGSSFTFQKQNSQKKNYFGGGAGIVFAPLNSKLWLIPNFLKKLS